jgi:transcription elongation factor GreA
MEKHFMTPSGRRTLEEELKRLIQEERPAVIQAIEEARAHGDLSENAEYAAAKERQSFIEGRIADLKGKLAAAEIVDPKTLKSQKVVFGATVTLEDGEGGTSTTYQIVGVEEADIKKGKISYLSPLARLLVGKSKGDVIEHQTTKGLKTYTILNIAFR